MSINQLLAHAPQTPQDQVEPLANDLAALAWPNSATNFNQAQAGLDLNLDQGLGLGFNLQSNPLIEQNDLGAVRTWLSEYQASPHTLRAYKKEAQRLLIWARHQRNKPLSALRREDLMAYEAHLRNPQALWIDPKLPRRGGGRRLFTGPLSPSSVEQALQILASLFKYLVDAQYLTHNPLSLRRHSNVQRSMKQSVIERYLDQELWQHVVQCVELWPASNLRLTQHYERARWLLRLLYGTGLRVSEAANSRAQDLHLRRGHWWLHVVGKGHALGDVPISDELIKSYARYRVFHGLSPLPKPEESTPLILPLGGLSQTCLSPNALYLIVKKIFAVAAQAIEQQDAHAAQHLRRASTHWLRHTAATHQADAGNDLRFIQKNLRHASLSTTSVYLHADDDQRHAATTKAKSKPITT